MTTDRIGLIAGWSKLPLVFISEAQAVGKEVITVGIKGETLPEVERASDKFFWIGLGQLGKLINVFKKWEVKEAAMIGQVSHKRMFTKIGFDIRAMKLLPKLYDKKTDSILGAVVQEIEKDGIKVIDSTKYLQSCMVKAAVLTRKCPTPSELKDITFGRDIARVIAGLDIGQTVVVKDEAVLAVEAMEGTDEAIKRGGTLARKGAVVVKVSKPNQDMRFDVPVVGEGTLGTMALVKASVLVIDAEKTLVMSPNAFVKKANKLGIAVMAS